MARQFIEHFEISALRLRKRHRPVPRPPCEAAKPLCDWFIAEQGSAVVIDKALGQLQPVQPCRRLFRSVEMNNPGLVSEVMRKAL